MAPMKTATMYARSFSHLGLTNSPIFRRSDVNITRGKTANESCRLRITWLRIRSWAVPCSPKKIAVSAAGTIAIRRVMSRRSHARFAGTVERRRGDDQNRSVDKQRERQRDRRIEKRELHRLPLAGCRLF